ncbi:MAG TPA: 30S ribosome-binding factor RbfA, partial [Nevskiaceae bacterium]|nr:30S ribosome-binding factor RbfA [Nevskiaceae bacterium]
KLRLNTQLQRELDELIRETLTDPRLKLVSITRVDVAPDMRNATVMVSQLGTDEQLAAAVKALSGAAGKLRHDLGRRLHVRSIPTLHFRADGALREGDRVSGLIKNAVLEDRKNAEDRDDE